MMRDKIKQFNNLYNPALENIEKIMKYLRSYDIDHALFFDNDYHIKLNDEIISIQYPIPNIICKLDKVKTKIGLDIATSEDYIGFVKFTIKKDQISSFKFDKIKDHKFEIYGSYFCKEVQIGESIDTLKEDMMSPRESYIFIKIKVSSIQEILSIIDKFAQKIKKDFVITGYICRCGHEIEIDADNGQCPICGEDSPSKRKFEKICPACQNKTLVDKYGNGECECCGWVLWVDDSRCLNEVVYPNLISLNKAKRLYKENKSLRPDLNDFLEGLYIYSEMEFWYKGLNCCLFLRGNEDKEIEFGWSPQNVYYFLDKEDFIKNAKIDGEYVRDIWSEVENPKYM